MMAGMKSEDERVQTSWTLVGRIKNVQDQESWTRFYDLYKGLILGVSMKAGLAKEEAEDVLQATMASLSRKIGEFEADPKRGSFSAWLLQLTRWRIVLLRQACIARKRGEFAGAQGERGVEAAKG